MNVEKGKFTVFFQDPFWVGVWERIEDDMLSVSKVTFGSEPKDYEVYDFLLHHYKALRFSPAIKTAVKEQKRNPKRFQRDIKRAMQQTIGTKSQQALQLQREQRKEEHKQISRKQKEAVQKQEYQLRQQKKKAKHRGR